MAACRVKLPEFELLKFDGQNISWQEFLERFEQVIHTNNQIMALDKFGYLRPAVEGEAAIAIKGLPPTSRCYEDAVILLKKRFGNENFLVRRTCRSSWIYTWCETSMTSGVSMDYAVSTLSNMLTERQKKFAKYVEQLSRVHELSGMLQTSQTLLTKTIEQLDTLNKLLPPDEQLEPFIMVTG
ncbi:hypothetical protein ISCGN_019998 [Ixodes scapularis]